MMRNPSSSSSVAASGSINSAAKTACCSKIGLKRGPWTPQEDELLADYIKKEGEGRWRTLPKRAGLLRCGKSCRLRWMNYLRPSVKRGQIAPDEEDLILRLHRLLGNRWSLIAGRIPGRTDNEIKNYWNTHLSRKLISQGIDPRTHKPLNPDSIHNQNKASSSSKPTKRKSSRTNPHNNPPSSSSGVEETIRTKENMYLDHQYHVNTIHGYISLLHCSEDVEMRCYVHDLGNSINNNNDDDEDEDINYCSDDVFSSFLDSLINEEASNTQQQQQQAIDRNLPSSDPMISINTFGVGTGWESTLISSSFSQVDPSGRINDHLQ